MSAPLLAFGLFLLTLIVVWAVHQEKCYRAAHDKHLQHEAKVNGIFAEHEKYN